MAAQVRHGPLENTPAYRKQVADSQARGDLVADIKNGRKSATNAAKELTKGGGESRNVQATDRTVAADAFDIAHRLKTSRNRIEAREFFKDVLAANDRQLRGKGRLSEEERFHTLLQQAQILGLELGAASSAKPYMDAVSAAAPDDSRGHVLYDRLSSYYPEVFPPVRRKPNGSE